MSTTSPTVGRPIDHDDLGRARPGVTRPRRSLLHRIIDTDGRIELTIARLGLALVMLPHALQKLFGWFGGYGLSGTHAGYVNMMHVPSPLAVIAIAAEIFGAFALLVGVLSRAAALAIIAVMLGAIVTVHIPNGFFMNWGGNQGGEGFEYHLLAITLGLVVLVAGGGGVSVDRAIINRRRTPSSAF